jgi:hypothetical protein
MDLAEKLIAIQIAGVAAYFGVAFALYRIYVEALKARITQKDDQIADLKSRLEAPRDLEAKLKIYKETFEQQIKQAEKEKEQAILDGNKAVEKERAEGLTKLAAAENGINKILDDMKQIGKKQQESNINRLALIQALKDLEEKMPPIINPNQVFSAKNLHDQLNPPKKSNLQKLIEELPPDI